MPHTANLTQHPACVAPSADLSGASGNTAYRQADDLCASFKVPEWGVFCHTEKLRNSPLRLKLLLSDSARVGHRFNGQRCACWVGHCRLRFRLSALHLGIPVTVRSRVRKKYVQQIETDLTLPLLEPPYPVKTPRIGANHGIQCSRNELRALHGRN